MVAVGVEWAAVDTDDDGGLHARGVRLLVAVGVEREGGGVRGPQGGVWALHACQRLARVGGGSRIFAGVIEDGLRPVGQGVGEGDQDIRVERDA